MPVDKFGRSGTSSTSGDGVSVSYVNNHFLQRNGTNTGTGSINMTGNTLTNVSDPVNVQDIATKNYVDGKFTKTAYSISPPVSNGSSTRSIPVTNASSIFLVSFNSNFTHVSTGIMGAIYSLLTIKQRGMILTYEHPYIKFITFIFRRIGNNIEISEYKSFYSDNFGRIAAGDYQLAFITTYSNIKNLDEDICQTKANQDVGR